MTQGEKSLENGERPAWREGLARAAERFAAWIRGGPTIPGAGPSDQPLDSTDRESERFFLAVFENIPLMIFVKDAEQLRFVRFNRAAEELLGFSRADMIGKNDYDFFDREQADFFVAKDREVLRNKRLVDIPEEPIQTLHRGQRFLHTMKIPILDDRGEPLYLLGISEDITDRKRAQEALSQAKEAADAASRAKSLFLANMSHEIRSPMNAILGFTQLMQGDPAATALQLRNLDLIMNSGEHLLAILNDVLEMSRVEAGRLVLDTMRFDLFALVSGIESMFRHRAEEKRLELRVERAPDVPRFLRADQGKLRQILINLLSNAVKFTQQGVITVRVGFAKQPDGSGALSVEVEDTGLGITDGELERLFRPFEQTDEGRRAGGTGLGLAISRQYVTLMGGTIGVGSKAGAGSVFRLDLPVKDFDSKVLPEAQPEARIVGLLPGNQERRVLIVDDQPANRQILVALLKPLGLVLKEAESGEEALAAFQEWKPDLILMDIRMDGMDGLEATTRIKAMPGGSATPVVAVTAGAFEEERVAASNAGADAFVRKPFQKGQIFELVARYLGLPVVREEPAAGAKAGDRSGPR